MLIVQLFISYAHVNLCHFFSPSWCQGLAVVSACGSSWTFLFTFLCFDRLPFNLWRKLLTVNCLASCMAFGIKGCSSSIFRLLCIAL